MQHSSVEYFRGVNFHLAVLSHEKLIMEKLPTFVADKSLTQLKSIEDSVRLGQLMLIYGNIVQLCGDKRVQGQATMKTPKYTMQEQQGKPMSDKGIYMVIENDAKSN